MLGLEHQYGLGDNLISLLMPNATPAQRAEARANLINYIDVMIRIAKRLERERLEKRPSEAHGLK